MSRPLDGSEINTLSDAMKNSTGSATAPRIDLVAKRSVEQQTSYRATFDSRDNDVVTTFLQRGNVEQTIQLEMVRRGVLNATIVRLDLLHLPRNLNSLLAGERCKRHPNCGSHNSAKCCSEQRGYKMLVFWNCGCSCSNSRLDVNHCRNKINVQQYIQVLVRD